MWYFLLAEIDPITPYRRVLLILGTSEVLVEYFRFESKQQQHFVRRYAINQVLPKINVDWKLGNMESLVIVLITHINGFLACNSATNRKQNTNLMYKETCRRTARYF